MHIRHERPMPDLSFRISAPLDIEFADGQYVSVVEWSLSGVVLPTTFKIGKSLPKAGRLSIPFQGVSIQFPVKFAQSEEKGNLDFVDLTGRQRETLALFYRSILSGSMASTNEIITSLDTPVDLVPMGETDSEKTDGKKKETPRFLRALGNIILYSLLAAFVFGVLGSHIWTRLNTIELQHSRLVAPELQLAAPASAFVQQILVAPGERFSRGDTLVRLNDPNRMGAIADTRREIKLAERRLRQIRDQLRNHETKRARYRKPYLDAYADAISHRHIVDFFGGHNLQQVALAWRNLNEFDNSKSLALGDFNDVQNQIRTLMDEQKLDLKRLKRALSIQKSSAFAFDVVATTDGTVQQVLAAQNQYVRRGEPVILAEENRPRNAVGWLDDRLADRVFVGMPAAIIFTAGRARKSVPGTVTNIEIGPDPARPNAIGMIVTVAADNTGVDASRLLFTPNAPARIDLSRNLLQQMIHRTGLSP